MTRTLPPPTFLKFLGGGLIAHANRMRAECVYNLAAKPVEIRKFTRQNKLLTHFQFNYLIHLH